MLGNHHVDMNGLLATSYLSNNLEGRLPQGQSSIDFTTSSEGVSEEAPEAGRHGQSGEADHATANGGSILAGARTAEGAEGALEGMEQAATLGRSSHEAEGELEADCKLASHSSLA